MIQSDGWRYEGRWVHDDWQSGEVYTPNGVPWDAAGRRIY